VVRAEPIKGDSSRIRESEKYKRLKLGGGQAYDRSGD
jgi:hypothetical protein